MNNADDSIHEGLTAANAELRGNSESQTMRGLRENAKATTEALRDAGRKVSATASELGENAYQFGSKTGAQIAHTVEEQPMASVLIAAALGLIAGMLLARR
jgi:ElaB/YqjD/DUF883 family membrane-anchored ribosome-binding protein